MKERQVQCQAINPDFRGGPDGLNTEQCLKFYFLFCQWVILSFLGPNNNSSSALNGLRIQLRVVWEPKFSTKSQYEIPSDIIAKISVKARWTTKKGEIIISLYFWFDLFWDNRRNELWGICDVIISTHQQASLRRPFIVRLISRNTVFRRDFFRGFV